MYRFDTAAGTDTPASLWGPYTDVVLRAGGYFKADPLGALPEFRAAEGVLWRKPMLGSVAIHADAVAVSGVDREPDPSEAFVSGVSQGQVDASIATAVAGLGATFAASQTGTRRLSSSATPLLRDVPPRWVSEQLRTVMASPPTIGAQATSSAIGSGKTWLACSGTSLVHGDFFTYLGAGKPVRRGSAGSDVNMVRFNTLSDPLASTQAYAAEFWFDGTTIEIGHRTNPGSYRVVVDGQLAGTGSLASNTGSYGYLPITFSTRKLRRVRVQFNSNVQFWGVRTGLTDTVLPTLTPRGPRCIAVGDSFIEGGGSTLGSVDAIAGVIRDRLGWTDMWASGVGGTGYLNPGSSSRVKFRDRVQNDVIDNNPDVVIIAGGLNDYASYSAAAIGTEAALLFAAIIAGLPRVQLIVVGPWWRNGVETFPANLIPTRDAIKAAALAIPGAIFVDLLEMPTQTTPLVSTTLSASSSASATSISVVAAVPQFATVEVGTGTANVERRVVTAISGSGPYTLTVSGLTNTHTSGDVVTTMGACLWTGTGYVGSTTGSGNSDLLVSSDHTHPSDAGHEAIGEAIVAQICSQLVA